MLRLHGSVLVALRERLQVIVHGVQSLLDRCHPRVYFFVHLPLHCPHLLVQDFDALFVPALQFVHLFALNQSRLKIRKLFVL